MSTVRKLFSVNAIIAVSLAIGFLNNVAISGIFGLNRAVDAYFASSILGSMFMYLIVDYLGRNFLPIYASRFQKSPDEAARVASTVITLLAIVSSVAVGVLLYFSVPIFTLLLPGFNEQDIGIVTRMFSIQAPSIVLMTVNNFHQYLWQHDEGFNRVVFARLFLSLTLLVFVLGGYFTGNVYTLAMGLLGGHFVSAIVLAYRIPYRFRFALDLGHADVKKILANSALLTGSGLITRLRGPIQQYFASQLGEGAIAAMSIAIKMCKPIYETSLMGVRMIVFSRSSKQVAKGNFERLSALYDYALSAVLLGVMPLAVWMAFNAENLISVVFLRGEFTQDMVALVTLGLLGAVAGIVFHGLQQMLSNSFYALQKISVPMIVLPVGTLLYYFCMKYMSASYGIFGVTATGSIVAATMSITLTLALSIVLPTFSAIRVLRRLTLYFIVAFACGYIGVELTNYLELTGLLRLTVSFCVMVSGYSLLLWISREQIFARVVAAVRSAILVT